MGFLSKKKKNDVPDYIIEKLDFVRHELLDVYKLIFKEENWCRRAMARDENGEQLFNAMDERATSWCLLGAIYKKEKFEDTLTFTNNYARIIGIDDLYRFNDLEGHDRVLDLLEMMLKNLGVKLTFYDKNGKIIG